MRFSLDIRDTIFATQLWQRDAFSCKMYFNIRIKYKCILKAVLTKFLQKKTWQDFAKFFFFSHRLTRSYAMFSQIYLSVLTECIFGIQLKHNDL